MSLESFRTQFFASAPRYEWLDTLGRGGMGVVFKAKDRDLDEVVAIKVLYGNVAVEDGAILARFKREISLNRKVKHPNVARMYDFGTVGGHPFITMEYVPGKDLQTLILEEGRIAPSRALPILRQICLGTQAAHEQGIVHRDLKSQNIIVGADDLVSILDFGLARGTVDEKLTLDAVVLGTPHYISPEQAMGQPADARSDLYSIGIIAFEMLTGVLPFTADSALGIAMKQISETVPGNLSLYPDVTPELRAAVHRALEKRREDRFSSASEFEAALGRVASAPPRPANLPPRVEDAFPPGSLPEGLLDFSRPRREAPDRRVETRTPVATHRARQPDEAAPPSPPAPVRTAPGTLPAPPRPPARPTVFVVLADGAERIALAQAFNATGCTPVEARSGEEALELLMSRSPDAVILDVVLPKTDGFEVARILKGTPTFAKVPVLLLGARVDRAQEHFAKQVGADAILARPVAERELVERAWRLLAPRGFHRTDGPAGRPGPLQG
jgi:serine/threonine protein kinase